MAALTIRLDDDDHQLLKLLSIVEHKSANQIVVDLVRQRFDQIMPGKRERAPGSAAELLRKALGLNHDPVSDATRKAVLEDLERAERHADALRAEPRSTAAGGANNGHMTYPIDADLTTHTHVEIDTQGRQGSTEPGRRPGRAA